MHTLSPQTSDVSTEKDDKNIAGTTGEKNAFGKSISDTKGARIARKPSDNKTSAFFGGTGNTTENVSGGIAVPEDTPKDIIKRHTHFFKLDTNSLAAELYGLLATDSGLVNQVLNYPKLDANEKQATKQKLLEQVNNTGVESLTPEGRVIVDSICDSMPPDNKTALSVKAKMAALRKSEKEEKEKQELLKKQKEEEKRKQEKIDAFNKRFDAHKVVGTDFTDPDLKSITEAKFKALNTTELKAYHDNTELIDSGAKQTIAGLILDRYVEEVDNVPDLAQEETDKKYRETKLPGDVVQYEEYDAKKKEWVPMNLKGYTDKKNIKHTSKDQYNETVAAFRAKKQLELREKKVMQLSEWARQIIADQPRVEMYLARTDVPDEMKVQTLQKMAVEIGRMEFLLGTMYYGGLDKKWETEGENTGKFPLYYQSQIAGETKTRYAWCTMFAGYLNKKIGLSAGNIGLGKTMPAFWSGYRMETWAKEGKNIGKDAPEVIKDKKDRAGEGAAGGAYISRSQWTELYNSLVKNNGLKESDKNKKEAKEVVKAFFAKNAQPQSGDLVFRWPSTNAKKQGHDHTATIEKYDADNCIIYTVEGNAGTPNERVKGARLDLTEAWQVNLMYQLVRIGAKWYGGYQPQSGTTAIDAKANQGIQDEFMAPMNSVVSKLVTVAVANGWIAAGSTADNTVYEWGGEDNSTGTAR